MVSETVLSSLGAESRSKTPTPWQGRGPGTTAPAPSTSKPAQPRSPSRQRHWGGRQRCFASLVPPGLSTGAATQKPDPFACAGSPHGSPCPLRRLYALFWLPLAGGTLHSPRCSVSAQHRGHHIHHVNGNTLL